jgi:glycosyltransferase involved in cell wall biosynthesis
MRILDSNSKSSWTLSNATEVDDGIVLKANGIIRATLSGSGKLSFKIISKNISGTGGLCIRLFDKDDNIIFLKNLTSSGKSWTEKNLNLSISKKFKNSKLEIYRPKNSLGRVQIGRVIIDGEDGLVPEEKKLEKVFSKKILIPAETPKRLAVIIPYGIYGGGEIYLKNIFSNPENPFVTDFIYLAKNPLEYHILNPKINHIKAKGFQQIKSILISNNYDIVVYYNSKKVYEAISELKVGKQISSEVIEIYHSNFVWPDAVANLRTRAGVDKIFRVSETLCDDIAGVKKKNTVPVGIDVDLFKRKDSARISGEQIHVGLVARLSPEKNIKYAIDLLAKNKSVKLSIVGGGPLKAAMFKYLKDNSINNIELVGHVENVADYYNNFDAFILTSKMEGTPISILEAMSFGLPIFSTDVGEIRANFGHLDNFYFLSGDQKLDRELLSRSLHKKCYFNNLREYILENHNIKLNSNLFFNLLLKNILFVSPKDESKTVLSGVFY